MEKRKSKKKESDKIKSNVFEVDDSGDSLELKCKRSSFCMTVTRNTKDLYDISLYLIDGDKRLEYNPGSLTDVDLVTPRYRKALARRVREAASVILKRVGQHQEDELDRILKIYAGAAHQIDLGPPESFENKRAGSAYSTDAGTSKKCSGCSKCKH
ncbi:hypothetical protein KY362_00235 [Candidatus Woesearchaeota archaeon]|nr:hypothetical protein [Candidatus Woesearchaeota archaeon]